MMGRNKKLISDVRPVHGGESAWRTDRDFPGVSSCHHQRRRYPLVVHHIMITEEKGMRNRENVGPDMEQNGLNLIKLSI